MPGDLALVTGGSGFVGGAIVRHLVAAGRAVRALARSDEAASALARAGAEPVHGDVLDPGSLEAAARGCAVVYHAAGVNALCRRDPGPMYRTNVFGSELIVRAAAAAGVRRVVHTSSAATIGEAPGAVGRETTRHRGWYLSHYERSKHLGERRALDVAADQGIEIVCVNPSSVQGPGRTTGTARLILDVVNGRLPVAVDTVLSFVDVEDCALGHLLAEERGRPGERYLLNGATLTTRAALRMLEEVTGVHPRVRFLPGWVARPVGALAEAWGRVRGREVPLCREAVRTLLHGHRYDGSGAERELGLSYTPAAETFRRTLAWYEERGLVARTSPPPDRGPSPDDEAPT